MDRREQSKALTSSGKARTEKPIQQKLPSRSDRTNQQNSQLEQQTGKAECFCRSSSRREDIEPSRGRCTLHTPIGGTMAPEKPRSPGVSVGSEYCSSDSEVSSETEPPVKNDSNSANTDSDADSESSNDSNSDSSSNDSSSSGSSSSSSSSNDDLNFTASAETPSQGVAAGSLRNNRLGTKSRPSEESLKSYTDQSTSSSSSNVASVDADLYYEPISFSPCNIDDKAEEKKQAIEANEESSLSSKQVSHQSHTRLSKPSLETKAADSSTDSPMNLRAQPVLGTRSVSGDEETVSHIPLPSTSDGGSSVEPTEATCPRNLVRIVMKKSGVTRGMSAKRLTKNPVINIFGEIVFDGCTFEGESRSPAERAADILAPSEVGQRELELNSEEIRNRVCNDILQKEIRLEIVEEGRERGGGAGEDILQKGIRRETGEGRDRGEDILQKGIRRETGEGRGRRKGGEKEEQEGEVDRKVIFSGGKVQDEGKPKLTVGKPKDSKNNSICDTSKNPQVKPGEESTERVHKRLVDYDDDDVGSCPGRSKSDDEDLSDESALRIARKKDLQPSDGKRSAQRNRKHLPELNRSYSRKRRHSPSTSSSDERDGVDGLEHPESTFDVKHRSEIIRNFGDRRSSCTTGNEVQKNSDKKFSDFSGSDVQRHSTEKRERMWEDFDRSESQTSRRNQARSTATTLKISGTNESNDQETNSEVERSRKAKVVASASRSKSRDHENLETEDREISDDEELKRRESRRPRDLLPAKISNKRKSSPERRPKSSAKTFSPDCHRFRSRMKRGPRLSPTRATTPDRNPRSRRSEIRYGEAEVRRSERRRRSSTEGPDDFASGKERLERTRLQLRASSDRKATEQVLDETRNMTLSKSAGIGSRSTTSRTEQSGKARSRSRSRAAYDDVSNRPSRRHSGASGPEEGCLRVGHGRREKSRHAESPSGGHRGGDESGTTRPSVSGRVSTSEGVKRVGEGRAGPRSSRDRTNASEDCSQHNDNSYHQRANYYPNDWMWLTSAPGHLKETPDPYPFPYLHPFAHPLASPMLRYNPYAYANYYNEDSRRYFLAHQPSSFYPNYHRPPHPYWAPPLHQNPYHPTYVPYGTAAGQGEGVQYEEDGGGCQDYGLPQGEIQDRAHETGDDDFRSSDWKADQEMQEGVSKSVAIQSSTASFSKGFDALGAAAVDGDDPTAEEESFSSPSAVQ